MNSYKPVYKRQKKSQPMREGDLKLASAVTFQSVPDEQTGEMGPRKRIKIAMDTTSIPNDTASSREPWRGAEAHQMDSTHFEEIPTTGKAQKKVCTPDRHLISSGGSLIFCEIIQDPEGLSHSICTTRG